MRHPRRLLMILLVLSFAALPAAAPLKAKAGRPVPGAELKRLKGVYTAYWKKHRARVKLNSDGTLRAVSENRFDEGRWKVEGDRLCVSFRVWTKGRFKCGRVYRRGGWYEGLYKNGRPRLRFRR
jgi:hypothetical protein